MRSESVRSCNYLVRAPRKCQSGRVKRRRTGAAGSWSGPGSGETGPRQQPTRSASPLVPRWPGARPTPAARRPPAAATFRRAPRDSPAWAAPSEKISIATPSPVSLHCSCPGTLRCSLARELGFHLLPHRPLPAAASAGQCAGRNRSRSHALAAARLHPGGRGRLGRTSREMQRASSSLGRLPRQRRRRCSANRTNVVKHLCHARPDSF